MFLNLLLHSKEKSKKNKVDDRLPRSAYFYLNNTIDLREDKVEIEASAVDEKEEKKGDKDSDKKKDGVPDKASKVTKADTASMIHKNNK